MIQKTKIALSSTELDLVCNKEWILTKRIIIEKVSWLFGTLLLSMQQHMQQHKEYLPVEAIKSNPKISRGENYGGLPYVILDYPRYFTKDATLAIRTIFWWGNFFSINLHLSGPCKEKAVPALKANLAALQQNGYWLCIHADPWQHHFNENNYLPLADFSAKDFASILHRKPFIKIAKRIPLQHWDDAPAFLENHFNEMMVLLRINFQAGEKGLSPGIPITGFDL